MTSQYHVFDSVVQRRFLLYRWVVYSAQVACTAAVCFVGVFPATIGEGLATELRLSATSLGLLGSLFFYIYAVMQVPAGYLSDTWGPRKVVTVGMSVMAVGQFIFAQANGLAVALAGRAVSGLGGSLMLIAFMKVMVNWFRSREFATLVGVNVLVGFGGSMLGTMPLALLVVRWGWRLPLSIVAAFSLALAVLNWALVRDDPHELGLPGIGEMDPDSRPNSSDSAAGIHKWSLVKDAFMTWRCTPTVWKVSVISMLVWGGYQAFQVLWAGPYLIHVHDKGPVAAGASLWLLSVGGGPGALLAGFVSDKLLRARRPFLIAGISGTALAWVCILATTGGASTRFINMTFLMLSFSAGVMLISQAMVKEAVRPELFGTVFGIVNTFPFLGNAFFQVVMGWLLNSFEATMVEGSRVYSPMAYWMAFLPACVASVFCVGLSLFVRESTKGTTSSAVALE